MFFVEASRGAGLLDVNLGLPIISKTITAKMLKLKIQFNMVEYRFRVYFSARKRLEVQAPLM